jgi:hypothetical protein
MAKVGRKQITYLERTKLFRNTPREIRTYQGGTILEYDVLIKSFTKEDYQLYEKLLHAYKRVDSMLKYCAIRNVSGPVLELANVRKSDIRTHQKIVQVLRHRWTNIWKEKQNSINEDSEKFWSYMARGIQRRCKDERLTLYADWEGPEGIPKMVEFFKELYEKQGGRCSVSNEPITLTVGTKSKNANKCSPDRKNSNKGYSPDNLWFVAWWVNCMKMDMPMITFWKRVSTLAEARGFITK